MRDQREKVAKLLNRLFSELPPEDQAEQQSEVTRLLQESGLLTFDPPERPLPLFLQEAIADNSQLDRALRGVVELADLRFATSPVDLILRILPTDSHLD